jgi:hypothetical protein
MQRRLAGTVIIDGTDDEWWPQSDEHVHREYNVQMILDEGQPAAVIQIQPVRWGGECRVELDLNARVVGTGQIQVEGQARLYEGTSESTGDLEDTKVVSFTVPKGGIPAHHGIHLSNTEVAGGDHAEIRISLTNSFIEPVE